MENIWCSLCWVRYKIQVKLIRKLLFLPFFGIIENAFQFFKIDAIKQYVGFKMTSFGFQFSGHICYSPYHWLINTSELRMYASKKEKRKKEKRSHGHTKTEINWSTVVDVCVWVWHKFENSKLERRTSLFVLKINFSYEKRSVRYECYIFFSYGKTTSHCFIPTPTPTDKRSSFDSCMYARKCFI